MEAENEFESGQLRIIDLALASPPDIETFEAFQDSLRKFRDERVRRATAPFDHLWAGRDLFDFPEEMVEALDSILERDRRWRFGEIVDELLQTVTDELTDEDRLYGYRSVSEFFAFLTEWRRAYRESFSR